MSRVRRFPAQRQFSNRLPSQSFWSSTTPTPLPGKPAFATNLQPRAVTFVLSARKARPQDMRMLVSAVRAQSQPLVTKRQFTSTASLRFRKNAP